MRPLSYVFAAALAAGCAATGVVPSPGPSSGADGGVDGAGGRPTAGESLVASGDAVDFRRAGADAPRFSIPEGAAALRPSLSGYVPTASPAGSRGILVPALLGQEAVDDEARTPFSLRGGIGFTLDPDTFLMTVEGDLHVTPNLLIGPLLQFGVADNERLLAPTANFQYVFDVPGEPSDVFGRLRPFVQAGLGLAYLHKDRGVENDDDVGFLINVGFGVEYVITDTLAVGNNLLFNILPHELADENFFFSWQFLTLSCRF